MKFVAIRHNATFQKANKKGADQTARMRRLVLAYVVLKPPETGYLVSGPGKTRFEKYGA